MPQARRRAFPRRSSRVVAVTLGAALAHCLVARVHRRDHRLALSIRRRRRGRRRDSRRFRPLPTLPWGAGGLTLGSMNRLASAAFAIAMLGAIESLLSAVIADGMTGKKHDPDAELIGLGIGNIVAPFFGGIAATGALARTATNVRAGARSPIAAVVHALVVLLAILVARAARRVRADGVAGRAAPARRVEHVRGARTS